MAFGPVPGGGAVGPGQENQGGRHIRHHRRYFRRGDTIKLIPNDYAYKIPESVNLYKKYLSVDRVFVFQGWGTGDTNALRPLVN